MMYHWYKIKRFLSPLENPTYLFWQIRRILFHWNKEMRVVEKAKLKCDMGLSWNTKERETMKIVLDRTITR